jgi:hypothetical protein
MLLFESPFLKIEIDEKMQAVVEEWKLDFTTTVENATFREPLEALINEFKNRKLTKWLCDNTEQKALNSPDQFWLEDYFYAQLAQSGLKTVALVNAKNVLHTSTAKNRLQNLVGRNLNIEIFNKNAHAKEWLAGQ